MNATSTKRRVRIWALLLCAVLLLGILPVAATTETAESDAPATDSSGNVKDCAVYNYADDLTPTIYLWNLTAADTVLYRVYATASAQTPLASAYATSGYCAVPMQAADLSQTGGTLWLSRQVSGKTESARVAVSYGTRATPRVQLDVYRLNEVVQEKTDVVRWDGASRNGRVATAGRLVAGEYYEVTVSLKNFTSLQSLTLPIKYDPTVLELTSLVYDTSLGGYKLGTAVSTGEAGDFLPGFQTSMTTSVTDLGGMGKYGLGAYPILTSWGVTQQTGGSGQQQTPYVNTQTGLVKLELAVTGGVNGAANAVDVSKLSVSNGRSSFGVEHGVVRLYFKCIAESSGLWSAADSPLHFATSADIPDGVTNATRKTYYCHTGSPNGCKAAIQGIDLLTPPPSMVSSDLYSSNLGTLTAASVYAMPQSLSATEQIRTLIENRVKVYNYVNSDTAYPLDSYPDVLVLTPTSGVAGAAKQNDQISVYLKEEDGSFSADPIAGPTTVDAEGGVVMKLGAENLLAEGGSVGVTITRDGVESMKVEIPYDAEVSRDVYFQLNTTGTLQQDGQAVTSDFEVRRGDQLRLDIYFNNFDDLLSYTFHMTFDPEVVAAADTAFRTLTDTGYISEEDFREGVSCLKVGEDLTDLTFNEEAIYQLWRSYTVGEITDADQLQENMTAWGISRVEELKEKAEAVEAKHDFYGTPGNSKSGAGGLFFTGPARDEGTNGENDPGRTEDDLYPYVNNRTGELRISSTTLEDPPMSLKRSGAGYHFLSIYFVAVKNGKPDFQLAGAATRNAIGVERVQSRDGTLVVLSGPGAQETTYDTVCRAAFQAHWNATSMEVTQKEPVLQLYAGNALATDADETALYLYEGYAFRDPGFKLLDANDVILIDTASGYVRNGASVTRYFMDGETKVLLPSWESGETLSSAAYFHVRDGKYSDSYDLIYEYSYGDEQTITCTRKVYVIYQRGDVNRDGQVDLFDEQWVRFGGENRVDDTLFKQKTLLDGDTLHSWLLGARPGEPEYVMPVARSPDTFGAGSDAQNAFQIWLEFYPDGTDPGSADTPLDAQKLPADTDVIAVVRYRNLSALAEEGLLNLAVSLSYDPSHLTLRDFQSADADGVCVWGAGAQSLNTQWTDAQWSDEETPAFTADASDRAVEGSLRQLYVQYLSAAGEFSFTQESGVLTAFRFHVSANGFTDSPVAWTDYALCADGTQELNRGALLDGTVKFQKPADVAVSNTAAGAGGYSVAGQVRSYNCAISTEVYLFAYNGDTAPVWKEKREILVSGAFAQYTISALNQYSSQMVTQDFKFQCVPNGKYTLVIKKAGCLFYTIEGISVNGGDVDLTQYADERVKLIQLPCGDLDGNGTINAFDAGYIYLTNNWQEFPSSSANKPECDLDGNGTINAFDSGYIYLTSNWQKNDILVSVS